MTFSVSIQLWPGRDLDLRDVLSVAAGLGYHSVQPYPAHFATDCAGFKQILDEYSRASPAFTWNSPICRTTRAAGRI